MTLLAELALRSSVILGAGLLFDTLLKKHSAALRHCVLAGAIAAAAVVLPLALVLPAWVIAFPTPPAGATPAPPPAGPVTAAVATPSLATVNASVKLAGFSATGVWLAGFLGAAGTLLIGVARLVRIASRADRSRDERWTRMTAAVAASYGLHREIVLLQTDAPDLLATWGVFRPRVLLPSHACRWSDDRVHVVLCHELAHIRRLDWLVQMSAEALRTVLWFNPLIWIACTRLRRAGEQACDDAVLGRGVGARDYATHLLDLARTCRSGAPPLPAVPMARPSTLERRIADMLNPELDRRALSHRSIGLIAALLLAVTLPAAALRAGQSSPAPLSGSVYDSTGAVLPGVAISLEDVTQMKFQAVTDAAGRFGFTNVQPGHYVLSASVPGFRALRQEFDLQARRDWDRAITLQVGDLRETITVSATRSAASSTPSQPRAPQPIRVGGNIRVPRKLTDVKPVYPASMREAGREGTVPLEAIIGQDGTVTSVRVVSAQVHPDFAIAAVDAVRQWRFSPTLLNGNPVEVVMTVSIDFKLADQ